jgi:hypothetical protein
MIETEGSSILLIGVAHIGARALLLIVIFYMDLAISLAYPRGEEVGLFIVHLKNTCLRDALGGGGVSTLWPR